MTVTGEAMCETGDNQGDQPTGHVLWIEMMALHKGAMGRLIGEETATGVQGSTTNGYECQWINHAQQYFTTDMEYPTRTKPGQENGLDAPTEASTGSTAGSEKTASRSGLQNYFATEMRDMENLAGGHLETAMAQILSVRSFVIQE